MWFWLVAIVMALGAIAIFIFAKNDAKAAGIIPIVILFFYLIFSLAQYSNNCDRLTDGQKLAQAILDNKRFEAKLEGDVVNVPSSKFDITNILDMELFDKIQAQADYVSYYDNSVKGNAWLEWFHPKTDKPLLKIVIVK